MRAYEQDYAGWAEDTAKAISEGRWQDIDQDALADEVESLAGRDRRELKSRLIVLLQHLLKTRYQADKQTRGWGLTILTQRNEINTLLEESPSLRTRIDEFMAPAYREARLRAAYETGLPIETFPASCEWTFTQMMGE